MHLKAFIKVEARMNKILKFFVLFLVLMAFSIASYLLIFHQGLIGGVLVASLFLFACLVLFGLSVYGIVTQRLKFMGFRDTGDWIGLMGFSLFLSVLVGCVAAANSFVEYTVGDNNLAYEEKTRLFASTVFQVPSQKELKKTEKNGVTYFHSAEDEQHIEKIDKLLQKERAAFNAFFGTEDSGGLTIEFHTDYESLEKNSGIEGVAGYYNAGNRTIHLVPDDEMWELILLHEYTHYQSHLFSEENYLPVQRIPAWFEEGLADFLAEDNSYWYDLDAVEIIDFHRLDSNADFEQSSTESYDPYAQSFLAVQSLVTDYGTDFIPEILGSESTAEFYSELEDLAGMDLQQFQETFLSDMEEEQKARNAKLDQAYRAIEKKQFEKAEELVNGLKKSGNKYSMDEAYWMLTDIYLEQGLYEKAIASLEEKISQGEKEFMIDDLLLLAEVQLVIDPIKSLEHVKAANAFSDENGDYYDPAQIDMLLEAYQKINSRDPAGGYKLILEQELVWNPYVLEELKKKLSKEYPGKF
jgi:hypothetical protein